MTAHPNTPRVELAAPMIARTGWADAAITLLAGDASFRKYYRLTRPNGSTTVLMDAPPPTEDVRPFVRIARHLAALGLSAPEILAEDAANGFLLLEDLGDATFTRRLADGADEAALYHAALDVLLALHALPPAQAIPDGLPEYDPDRMVTEVCRLTDWWLPLAGLTLPAEALAEYETLWRTALTALPPDTPCSLALLDYHVDNLIDLPDRTGPARVGLLDFQDAVAAPAPYDLVSLIDDARRDVSPALARDLLARYRAEGPAMAEHTFTAAYALMGAQRHARIVGTFARLYRRDGKAGYLVHLPRVWRQLDACLAHPVLTDVRGWFATHVPEDLRTKVPA